jgi:hypothetical protein
MNILNALKGIGGDFEIQRVVGAAGVLTYVIAAPAFLAWAIHRGDHYDLVAFCAAYPAGLGVAMGALAGAISLKDRSVAAAKAVAPAPLPDAGQ